MNILTPSVQYFIAQWIIQPPRWSISYLRELFNPLHELFHTSVKYLTPSWIIAYLSEVFNPLREFFHTSVNY